MVGKREHVAEGRVHATPGLHGHKGLQALQGEAGALRGCLAVV